MQGNINDITAIRNDQREEVRRNRMAMRGDIQPVRPSQQPELLTLVLEHLDLMNRAKRLIATPADNPRKAYFTARVVEIRDYLANVDKHIAELVQQERDELTLEGYKHIAELVKQERDELTLKKQ